MSSINFFIFSYNKISKMALLLILTIILDCVNGIPIIDNNDLQVVDVFDNQQTVVSPTLVRHFYDIKFLNFKFKKNCFLT